MNRLLSASQPLRPRCLPQQFTQRFPAYSYRNLRRATSTLQSTKTGAIDVGPGETLLYFDNVFPLKTALWDIRYLAMRWDKSSIESRIKKQCIPSALRQNADPATFSITDIIPRQKDGGAFVKFNSENPEEAERQIAEYLKDKALKPWFAPFTSVRSFIVQGKPWVEDLYRYPSSRLRVEFVASDSTTELSQEALYALFRQYGKIADITVPPAGAKDLPKSATIQFLKMRSATAAKNCMHGFTVHEIASIVGKEGGVALRILYERTDKSHWIRDWLVKHPRIIIPVLAALLATFTVAIFDPVRTWFIKAKVTRSLHFSEYAAWGWLKDNTIARLTNNDQKEDDLSALWEERKESIEKMNGWLQESEETFIVVQGPRGSGKRELVVDSVLKKRKNVLVVDCEPINEAHGESATIAAAAAQVGYRPVFSWMNTISSVIDLAAQGTIGTSTGFSQTLENQFNKILQNTGVALKQIALEQKSNNERDEHMSDDEYLSAHPERRPIVVIDNFLHVEGNNSIIFDRLADWAALLVSSNVAHVVFLTNDITFSKSLARSLPDRVFRSIFLGDALPDSAMRYIMHQIQDDDDTPHAVTSSEKFQTELNSSISALGGRLTDLDFLARRIKTGETPSQAVHEIIETSAAEILKLYILDSSKDRKWTPEQAWHLVSHLATNDKELAYNDILLHDLFKTGGEDALQALESSELIAIVNHNGRPYSVKPGKPVFRTAFGKLVKDKVLKAKMEMACLKNITEVHTKIIRTAEDELAVLATLDKKPKARVEWLLQRIQTSQEKVEVADKETVKLKQVLKKEF